MTTRIPVEIHNIDLDPAKIPEFVGIVGSREFEKRPGCRAEVYADMLRYINKFPSGTTIVSGGAIGVDTYAEEIAKNFHRPYKIFRPDNTIPSPARYFKRNRELVKFLSDNGGALVSFIMRGYHDGTTHTIQHAREFNVPRLTFIYSDDGSYLKTICDKELLKEFVKDA